MATPVLDTSLLQHFVPIVLFLLVWVIVYSILHYSKMFGDNKIIQAFIGFLLGLMVLMVPEATSIIGLITPWFTVLFVIIVLSLVFFRIFGATDDQMLSTISNSGGLRWTIIIIVIVIVLGAFSQAFGDRFLGITTEVPSNERNLDYSGQGSTNSQDFNTNLTAVLFHPKIIGTVFLMLVAAIAILLLSSKMKPDWP